jgi:hypothetical protein
MQRFAGMCTRLTQLTWDICFGAWEQVAPIGYLVEAAGGKTSEGTKSVLDILITETEQRSQASATLLTHCKG